MDCFCERTYKIGSRDVDLFGHCRPSAILGILQEAATDAAAEIHASREEVLERYHVFWMLSRIRYTLKRPLNFGEVVSVKTWHRGGKGVLMYREFELRVADEVVGKALSAWVLVDALTRKLFKLSDVEEFFGTEGGSLCGTDTLHHFTLPAQMSFGEKRTMRYSDTDVNGHVNNCHYADFACDCLELAKISDTKHFISGLQISYLAECRVGEELELYLARDAEEYFVLGKDETGKRRFQAKLTLDKLAQED